MMVGWERERDQTSDVVAAGYKSCDFILKTMGKPLNERF